MTKHILIVDDSAFLREQLRLLIERRPGWHVCEAVDGAEAVRKSQQSAPDAVVMDLRMPEMDGLAAGRKLRQMAPALMWAWKRSSAGPIVGEQAFSMRKMLAKPLLPKSEI